MPPVSFTETLWEEGSENLGGLLGHLLYIPQSQADISGLTCTDGVTLIGDFALIGSQPFIKVYATEDSIDLGDVQSGDFDGEKKTNTASFFFPGSKAEVEAFKRKIAVVPGIWALRDTDLNWRIMGLTALQTAVGTYTVVKDIQARCTAQEGTHARRADGRKGTTFTITQIAPHAPLFHSGALPETVV